jgi:hypothetical protein
LRFGLNAKTEAARNALAQQVTLNADGNYYVMWANHTGDTRGNAWYTDIICLSISARFRRMLI